MRVGVCILKPQQTYQTIHHVNHIKVKLPLRLWINKTSVLKNDVREGNANITRRDRPHPLHPILIERVSVFIDLFDA